MDPSAASEPAPRRDSASRRSRARDRLGVGELMLLIAGIALGLWLIGLRTRPRAQLGLNHEQWFLLVVGVLGGLALVGVPLLLVERRSLRRHWGPGRLLWFSTGTATWLMWPPIVFKRVVRGEGIDQSLTGACYAYGTPMMALYMTLALVAGGWLRRRRTRRARRSWRERFGVYLGLAWACTGLYVLYLLYAEDFQG
jgi:hypothetical protein